jgi:hypothetical protein
MDKEILISVSDTIFATGVFLQPVKCKINGIVQWRWVAVSFEDDSFFNGKIIKPNEYAENLENVVNSRKES